MANQVKQNSLDLEYNSLLARLGKIKDLTGELHGDVSNLSIRLQSLSKRKEISEEFKAKADAANTRLQERLKNVLRVIEQK